MGKKGRGYGKGVIVTPAASLCAARERLVFEVEIPEAMKLFKATEDRAPKSHEEFMEKIIKANNIHLPELPEGDRYKYDPKTEQLMVESPRPNDRVDRRRPRRHFLGGVLGACSAAAPCRGLRKGSPLRKSSIIWLLDFTMS